MVPDLPVSAEIAPALTGDGPAYHRSVPALPLPPASSFRVVCREIRETDLPAVAALLLEGFPDRTQAYWDTALHLLAAHASPQNVPRFGYLLAAGSDVAGVILVIHAQHPGQDGIRGNVSSWYVRPAYRAYAALLNQRATRDRLVTYVNISPAPHTLPVIGALGFTQAMAGLYLGLAIPGRRRAGVRAAVIAEHSPVPVTVPAAEARLLADHAAFGCLCVWLETPAGNFPFIFRRRVLRREHLPCAMVIFCPSLRHLEQFSGPLGAVLARNGMPFLLAGADRRLRGFPGWHFRGRLPVYAKGVFPQRYGDLCYTEAALFGM